MFLGGTELTFKSMLMARFPRLASPKQRHLLNFQQQIDNMLPPVDPEILSANPQFDALYRDLCTNKLKEDGTTKVDAKAQKERDAFKEELRKARVAAAKQNLIKSYLSSLSYRGDDLPSEVRRSSDGKIGLSS